VHWTSISVPNFIAIALRGAYPKYVKLYVFVTSLLSCLVLSWLYFFLAIAPRSNPWTDFNRISSIFYKIRTTLPEEILRMIYFAFVHSHLLYGIDVYVNTTANHLSKLNVLNNRWLRTVQKKSIKTHNNDLYKSYFTLPNIQLLYQFNILLFMHNYVNHRNKLPVVFSTYFEENKVIHKYNTRQKDDFHVDTIKSEIGKKYRI